VLERLWLWDPKPCRAYGLDSPPKTGGETVEASRGEPVRSKETQADVRLDRTTFNDRQTFHLSHQR
jgi:hypothetical protein